MHQLQQWRARSGLTQAALADRIGITRPHLSRLECGERGLSASMLHRLAEALELSPEERLQALELAAAEDQVELAAPAASGEAA